MKKVNQGKGNPLGPPTRVFGTANFRGFHTLMRVWERGGEGGEKTMKLYKTVSLPEI